MSVSSSEPTTQTSERGKQLAAAYALKNLLSRHDLPSVSWDIPSGLSAGKLVGQIPRWAGDRESRIAMLAKWAATFEATPGTDTEYQEIVFRHHGADVRIWTVVAEESVEDAR